MKKKIFFSIMAIVVALVIILIIVLLSSKQPSGILLKDGMTVPQANCAHLSKVNVIHEAGCPACAVALPRLRELEQELNMSFSYYDIVIDKDKERLLAIGVIPTAVPTVIINCKVYVGVRSKDEYKQSITSQ